ncbi:MAG: cytochrome c biogenesis protein CcsA [Armatimonadetes bacterium]|nr:cytochrome c biogenesis protein CcsA [Armatimonadota bacterium]
MTLVCYLAEGLALLGYLVAAVLYPQRLLRPESRSTRYARWGLILGAGLQGIGLLAHAGRAGGQVILGEYANVSFLFVLMIVAALLVLEARTDRPALGAFLAPVVFLLVLLTMFEGRVELPPIVNPWFISHIVLTLLAYVCFGAAFCMAMAYLVVDLLLKRKRLERVRLLPPLHVADRTAHVAVAVGFPIFTLGLGVGAAFFMARQLQLDIKMILSLVTWAVYAVYLFVHDGPGWRGRRLHLLLVLGFVLVLVNYTAARHHFKLVDLVAGA